MSVEVSEPTQQLQDPPQATPPDGSDQTQLPAETITVRIRWFGLCIGYILVNFVSQTPNRPELNAILTLGAGFALLDTLSSLRGKVFLGRVPLFISLMEAVFIGLLCHFESGVNSPFRFYYFLSLLVCAIRYSPAVTYSTLAIHTISYGTLALSRPVGQLVPDDLLMVLFMVWVTWAGTSLVSLLKAAGARLVTLNQRLRENQQLLEDRIDKRTQQLQESQALLVQQEKQAAFGLLAAGIAHEVGNPLAAISSLVQLMNRRELDDYMHEKLGLIDEQLLRIQRTLRELVEFSRPGSTDVSDCSIHDIVDSALSIAKYYKRKKGKTIQLHLAERLPPIRVIRDRVLQVVLNLILNALDATEEGANIHISADHVDGFIEVVVRDSGSGIALEDQKRIFLPYFTTKPTGTGLGLFVCRKILIEAGGEIELLESSSQGTAFRITLPVADPAPDEAEEQLQSASR